MNWLKGLTGTRGRTQTNFKGAPANIDLLKKKLNENGQDLEVIKYQSASSFSGEMYIRLSEDSNDKTVYPLYKDNAYVAPYGWNNQDNDGFINNSSGIKYKLGAVTLFKVIPAFNIDTLKEKVINLEEIKGYDDVISAANNGDTYIRLNKDDTDKIVHLLTHDARIAGQYEVYSTSTGKFIVKNKNNGINYPIETVTIFGVLAQQGGSRRKTRSKSRSKNRRKNHHKSTKRDRRTRRH